MTQRKASWNLRRAAPVLPLLLGMMLTPLLAAQESSQKSPAAEQFFIISSIDLKKNQLVLKRPTEVTELMQMTPQTVCLDDEGKNVHPNNLRAGDTVFIISRQEGHGLPVAVRIRMGYMTYSEVLKQYLQFTPSP
jgi:hypothetical protein